MKRIVMLLILLTMIVSLGGCLWGFEGRGRGGDRDDRGGDMMTRGEDLTVVEYMKGKGAKAGTALGTKRRKESRNNALSYEAIVDFSRPHAQFEPSD